MHAQPGNEPGLDQDPMKILLVDDDDLIQDMVQVFLENGLPDVEVVKYNPVRLGRPGPVFDWAAHDLLLLDYELGLGETGVDWLETFGAAPGFPPTILLTGSDNPEVVGEAVSRGASGYLNKTGLTPQTLVETVRKIVQASPAAGAGTATEDGARTTTDVGAAARDDGTTTGAGTATGDAGATSGDDGVTTGGVDDGSAPTYQGRDALKTGAEEHGYRLTRLIGRGGMARVYLATRIEDGVTVVLKLLDRDLAKDPENVKRFAREGELISKVDSPYVVKIYDHGATSTYGYIAMEFFGRGDLAQQIELGIAPDDAALYLHNIACGLDAVHRAGIVHRDLKPGNVMFRGDGSMALADFGLSKGPGLDASLTKTGSIMGTPYSMSPEQADGHEADARSDLYSAGVLFYQMLTGERPYTGDNLPTLLLAIQNAPIPRLEGDLARFQPVLDRLLAKEPADRYQSAAELIDALAPFLG